MRLVIAYDIADDRRRRQVAQAILGYGERVQESVFECDLNREQYNTLQHRIAAHIDTAEDRVRYYLLCAKDHAHSGCDGTAQPLRDQSLTVV